MTEDGFECPWCRAHCRVARVVESDQRTYVQVEHSGEACAMARDHLQDFFTNAVRTAVKGQP